MLDNPFKKPIVYHRHLFMLIQIHPHPHFLVKTLVQCTVLGIPKRVRWEEFTGKLFLLSACGRVRARVIHTHTLRVQAHTHILLKLIYFMAPCILFKEI